MLDIRLIREKPDFVHEQLATRGDAEDLNLKLTEVLACDKQRRVDETAVQQFRAKKNSLSKQIGVLKSRGENSTPLEAEVTAINKEIDQLNEAIAGSEQVQGNLLLEIPNLPHESVPVGKDPSANVVVRSWGEKPRF